MSDPLMEQSRRNYDAHQKEREVLFANESFLIGVLQVVSGGSLFAGIAQVSALVTLAGQLTYLVFLTFMATALTSSVVAAYFKHQYKMWDVKGAAVSGHSVVEAERRFARAGLFLRAMRWSMRASVVGFALGILGLVAASWALYLRGVHHPGPRADSIPAHVTPSVQKAHSPGTH